MRDVLKDDFEARIVIYSLARGGRRTPALNGIRWDFGYDDPPRMSLIEAPIELFMIWPEFLDVAGNPIGADVPLPIEAPIRARMRILSHEMRVAVHRERIRPGVRFFCHEGARRVAEGVVTVLTNLMKD